jgi:type 2 lantibiotic biosynthesis protein LanM
MPSGDVSRRPLPSDLKRLIAGRAATLAERAAAARRRASAGPPPDADADAVLQTWRQAFAPADDRAFERRLGWEGLDLDAARRVAAGGVPAAEDRLPSWTVWLDRIAAEAPAVEAEWQAGRLAEASRSRWRDEPPFVELWIPPLRAARAALGSVVPRSVQNRLTPDARWALERQLVREVALWGELSAFETFAADPVPQGRYRAFVARQLGSGLADLFGRFPVLARQVACLLDGWVGATQELLERLDADAGTLAEMLGDGQATGPVVRIDPALSDPHDGRRRVVALEFESGLEVVYKPRDIRIEAAFAGLLGWAAEAGLEPPLPAPRVLCRDGYGWVQRMRPGDQSTADGVDRYFRRAGALLCVAHVLRGHDLHMENVIATTAGPVLVDVEVLLQPVRGVPHAMAQTGPHAADESCLTTGLLGAFDVGPDGVVSDIGGLRGATVRAAASAGRVWTGLRSDDLKCAAGTAPMRPTANRVTRGGVVEPIENHAGTVQDGFRAAYRWFLDHREALLQTDGPLAAFARSRTRVLPRPTNQYAMLVDVLRTPRYQRDGARASAAMDILLRPFNRSPSRPRLWDLLVAERQALGALDIPCFWTPASGADVSVGADVVVSGVLARSGLDAVRDRLRSLSEDTLDQQARRLARAIEETPAARFVTAFDFREASGSASYVDAARRVGKELRRLVLGSGAEGPRIHPQACPHRLYDGTLGPALCFAALATVAEDEEPWADDARAALDPLIAAVEAGDVERWVGDGIGAGDGLGSLVYGLVVAGRLLGDPMLVERAHDVAALLDREVERDTHLDVIGGAAGAILALRALAASRSDPGLSATAAACGRGLVARAVRLEDGLAWPGPGGRLGIGFAHGAAGIAFALARLFAWTGEPAFGRAAAEGIRFVRSRSLGGGQWPVADIAADDATGAVPSMMAWCHGGAGVALALTAAADLSEEAVPAEVEAALAQASRWLPARPDHACCGTLGRCDVLVTIGRRTSRSAHVAAARALADRVVDRARRVGHFRLSAPGTEYRVFDPGFFRGLSGIGYGLARLADPDRLPSILAFDAPAGEEPGLVA